MIIAIDHSDLRATLLGQLRKLCLSIGGTRVSEERLRTTTDLFVACIAEAAAQKSVTVPLANIEPPGEACKAIGEAAARCHVEALAVLHDATRDFPQRRGEPHAAVANLAKVVAELAVAVKDAARYL